ncbi:INTRON-ENCODED HOMING ENDONUCLEASE putative-RELATED [Salix koriyanagi]|uniref:INTRON-ENCODED HOMING ENDONUCLEASE putative-RELATED n=1 Tax=Salix koriyanagi TaxID=2511006 RepID=A0A9Q0UZ46_9ROSI|nr:INTRON-ENCODED HOMING ENDONUCLEASE putative-RELATED [Salix koriyanagi]
MVGDRMEGCSRRGRGIKLSGLRSCIGPPLRSLTSWRDSPAVESWPAASELKIVVTCTWQRMSDHQVVRVGRLRACAPNCRPAAPSLSAQGPTRLAARRSSCVAYPPWCNSNVKDAEHEADIGASALSTSFLRCFCLIRLTSSPVPSPAAGIFSDGDRRVVLPPRNATLLILPVVICLSQRLSHACLDFGLGRPVPPRVCTGRLVPSTGDALPALTSSIVPPMSVTLKKLECSKQAYALDTLAWDNIIGFRSYSRWPSGIGVMINRDSLGAFVFHSRRRSDTVLVSTINDADCGLADVAFRTPPKAPYEKSKFLGSGGSMVARLKLKGIDGKTPPGVEPAA